MKLLYNNSDISVQRPFNACHQCKRMNNIKFVLLPVSQLNEVFASSHAVTKQSFIIISKQSIAFIFFPKWKTEHILWNCLPVYYQTAELTTSNIYGRVWVLWEKTWYSWHKDLVYHCCGSWSFLVMNNMAFLIALFERQRFNKKL